MTQHDLREEYVFLAKLAEQAERYGDMQEQVKQLALLGHEMTVEERNLLSVAYKNTAGERRAAWRVADEVVKKQGESSRTRATAIAYRDRIAGELRAVCFELIGLLDDHLIKSTNCEENNCFFWKLEGDYYRYLAELLEEGQRANSDHAKKAAAGYEKATEFALILSSTHPIRIGVALNFSVFKYEIENKKAEACRMSRDAFEEAIEDLDSLSESEYIEATLVMQLLKDNLTLWTDGDEEWMVRMRESDWKSEEETNLTLEDAEEPAKKDADDDGD